MLKFDILIDHVQRLRQGGLPPLRTSKGDAGCKRDTLECGGWRAALDGNDVYRHGEGRFQREFNVGSLHAAWQRVAFNKQVEVAATGAVV